MNVRLFVYGTLRRGAASHELMHGARHVGSARTMPRYTLVSFGWFPGLLAGGETSVVGELYDIDEGLIAALDDYEGEWFARETVHLEGGGEAIAWLARPEVSTGRPPIASGDFLAHVEATGNGPASPAVEGT